MAGGGTGTVTLTGRTVISGGKCGVELNGLMEVVKT